MTATGPAPDVGALGDPMAPLAVTGRLDRLRGALSGVNGTEGPPDGLLVTTTANIRWLTGFTGSAGVLLVTDRRALLTTDGRYRTQAAEQLAGAGVGGEVDVCVGGVATQREALADAAGPAATVGLEAGDVSWAAVTAWEAVFAPRRLLATQGVVEALREVKDDGEIARMERAAAIADAALGSVLHLLADAGHGRGTAPLTESGFAAALDHAMRLIGAEDRAFETIVASGENSAKPHARPGTRVLRPGDPVVVDFGATYDGYRSDMTRTFCLGGAPSGELATVFDVVAASQVAGVASVAPGVAAGDVDRVCREVITAAGWGDRFEHGTGHGVGLDVHERPAVGAGSTAILEPGTVVTVEPGVYLPAVGGVRIEDTLVVTGSGSRALTRFPKEVAV
ncbi:MAG: Xaa-Pro peptidase family protein [Acidimicrobiales bacterium]|jgi:Xaa-Pro aminopeptidase